MTLQELADRLYNVTDTVAVRTLDDLIRLWLVVFTETELVQLWTLCQADFGIGNCAWDDEVYNALHYIGYFEREGNI